MFTIDNNSLAFLICAEGVVSAMQEGVGCPALPDATGMVCVVKKGVPITIVSDVGEDVSVNIFAGSTGAEIANNVTAGQTPETGYTFTTYSNETYIVTK